MAASVPTEPRLLLLNPKNSDSQPPVGQLSMSLHPTGLMYVSRSQSRRLDLSTR